MDDIVPSIRCPSCGGSSVKKIGDLTDIPGLFKLPNPGGLHHCKTCHLYFRRPFLSTDQLNEAYRQIPATHWNFQAERNDYRLAFDAIIALKKSGQFLDVGCYRGDFLQLIPESFTKYGIEPSEAAANVAEVKGIQVFAGTLEAFDARGQSFDVITLIDVLEHMPYPFRALSNLASLLKPNGILVLSTGNTNALPWRLMRRDYWYYNTEHVSFFNPLWFRWAAHRLGLALVNIKEFSHQEGSFFQRWRQFAQCLAFITMKRLDDFPPLKGILSKVYPFSRAVRWSTAPSMQYWMDHLLVTLQAADSSVKSQALAESKMRKSNI